MLHFPDKIGAPHHWAWVFLVILGRSMFGTQSQWAFERNEFFFIIMFGSGHRVKSLRKTWEIIIGQNVKTTLFYTNNRERKRVVGVITVHLFKIKLFYYFYNLKLKIHDFIFSILWFRGVYKLNFIFFKIIN